VATSAKVYVNEDDALLFWSISELMPGGRDFAISRRRSYPAGSTEEFLLNRMGERADTKARAWRRRRLAINRMAVPTILLDRP
jgi:hypothetical protein